MQQQVIKMYLHIKHITTMIMAAGVLFTNQCSLAAEQTGNNSQRKLCQTQVLAPAVYQDSYERVLVQESSINYIIEPLVLGHGEQKVKIADGYVEYELIPAQFKEVVETIEIERERIEVVTEPPTYRTETKRIKIKEATVRWNPACAPVATAQGSELPDNCLIEVPAEYQNITRQVLETPARTTKKVIPARTQQVKRKILISPAKVIRREIPPQYTSVKLTKVEQAAKILNKRVEERNENVPIQKKIRAARVLTQPALCEDAIQAEDITALQRHLQRLGYYQGNPNGTLNTQTRTALTRFQEDNGLATGAITLETLRKLPLP